MQHCCTLICFFFLWFMKIYGLESDPTFGDYNEKLSAIHFGGSFFVLRARVCVCFWLLAFGFWLSFPFNPCCVLGVSI